MIVVTVAHSTIVHQHSFATMARRVDQERRRDSCTALTASSLPATKSGEPVEKLPGGPGRVWTYHHQMTLVLEARVELGAQVVPVTAGAGWTQILQHQHQATLQLEANTVSPCGEVAVLELAGLQWMERSPVRATSHPLEVRKASPFGRVVVTAGLDAMNTCHTDPTALLVIQPAAASAVIRERCPPVKAVGPRPAWTTRHQMIAVSDARRTRGSQEVLATQHGP